MALIFIITSSLLNTIFSYSQYQAGLKNMGMKMSAVVIILIQIHWKKVKVKVKVKLKKIIIVIDVVGLDICHLIVMHQLIKMGMLFINL